MEVREKLALPKDADENLRHSSGHREGNSVKREAKFFRIWLPLRDSNPDMLLQRQLSYR